MSLSRYYVNAAIGPLAANVGLIPPSLSNAATQRNNFRLGTRRQCSTQLPALKHTRSRRKILSEVPVTCVIKDQKAWNRRDRTLDEIIKRPDYTREMGRPYRRTVYVIEDWEFHRDGRRHLKNLRTFPKSEVLNGLLEPSFLCVGSSVFVCVYETLRETQPNFQVLPSLCVDALPFELTSSALGLLLVFRTEASYARWLDARKALAAVSASCRDAGRQAITWFHKEDELLAQAFVRWTKAYSKTLQHHLRGCKNDNDLVTDLSGYLEPQEIERLRESRHRPLFVMQMMTVIANQAKLNSDQHVALDVNMCELGVALSECERILTTPVPLSYTRFTDRFLLTWLVLLPTCLYPTCHWWCPPIEFFTAVLLLGIEEVGVQIEEPFSILPMEVLAADTVELLDKLASAREQMFELLPQTERAWPNEKFSGRNM